MLTNLKEHCTKYNVGKAKGTQLPSAFQVGHFFPKLQKTELKEEKKEYSCSCIWDGDEEKKETKLQQKFEKD